MYHNGFIIQIHNAWTDRYLWYCFVHPPHFLKSLLFFFILVTDVPITIFKLHRFNSVGCINDPLIVFGWRRVFAVMGLILCSFEFVSSGHVRWICHCQFVLLKSGNVCLHSLLKCLKEVCLVWSQWQGIYTKNFT